MPTLGSQLLTLFIKSRDASEKALRDREDETLPASGRGSTSDSEEVDIGDANADSLCIRRDYLMGCRTMSGPDPVSDREHDLVELSPESVNSHSSSDGLFGGPAAYF